MIMNDAVIRSFSEFGKGDLIPEEELYKTPIEECYEKLVRIDLPNVIIAKSEKRKQFDGDDFLYARESVVKRLGDARNYLPSPVTLKIFDAYRPLDFQQILFDEEYQKVKIANPSSSDEEIKKMVFVSVYPPNLEPEKAPPHSTGGALDVTLADSNGDELDMGSAYCEFGDKMYTNCTSISPKQRANRVLLLSAMTNAGFANYPGEWWHFMYGDREYAAYTSLASNESRKPIYSRADLNKR